MTKVRNNLFDPNKGLDRGRAKWVEGCWYVCKMVFFLSAFPWPNQLKCFVLKFFGARIGVGVKIKPRVNIHFPWKLEIGDHVWIGEEAWILNFEKIIIGSHSCISQRAFLCTGNHNYRCIDMPYKNSPIHIGEGAWIGAQVFLGPGVNVGKEAVVTAGSIVSRDVPAESVYGGVPFGPTKSRWKDYKI